MKFKEHRLPQNIFLAETELVLLQIAREDTGLGIFNNLLILKSFKKQHFNVVQ